MGWTLCWKKQSPGIWVQTYDEGIPKEKKMFVLFFLRFFPFLFQGIFPFRSSDVSRIILRWLFTWPETLTCQVPRSAFLWPVRSNVNWWSHKMNLKGWRFYTIALEKWNSVVQLGRILHRMQWSTSFLQMRFVVWDVDCSHQMQIVSRLQHVFFWRFYPSIAFAFFFLYNGHYMQITVNVISFGWG